MSRRVIVVASALVLVVLVVVGALAVNRWFNSTAPTAGSLSRNQHIVVHIKIVNNPKTVGKYVPAAIRVIANRSNSIVITNATNTDHTVTDRGGAFNTGTIAPGGTTTFTIRRPGLYHFYCKFHPLMRGTISALLRRQP